MVSRFVCVLSGAVAVAACATYHPAPLAPSTIARAYQARSLDTAATAAEIKRIAPSAQWTGQTWDRLSLFASALGANPAIHEARAHAASAEAAARAARAGQGMTLTLTAEYAGKAPESSPWLYGVTSDIPLDVSARRSSRISAAQFAAVAARYDYAEAVWAVRMAIRRALAERFLTAREVEIGEDLSQIRARQLTALERRVAGGEVVRSELERVRAEAGGDNRRLADAQARSTAASIALAEALGVPLSALKGAELSWEDFVAPALPLEHDVAAFRENALLSRADILRNVAAYDQAEAELRGEIARQWPEIHVGPGYTWERGLVKLPFSVGLTFPAFDLNRGAIGAAEARRVEAGAHLEAAIARAQAAIDGALAEVEAAHAALARVREVDVQTAKRVADQAEQELANGAIDRVDWSAAQAGLRLAQLAEIEALRRAHAADAALEEALRRPLEGPELQIAPLAKDVPR